MSDKTHGRFKISLRLITMILVVALLISYVVAERSIKPGPSPFRINIIVPWGLIAVFISLYIFNESNRMKRAKREERREYMQERRQELLDNVVKGKNKNSETTKKDSTG